MKPKYYLPLPNHPELIDQDKTRYRNVVQWRYDTSVHGRFLERDRLVRSATRETERLTSVDRRFRGAVIGICLIVISLYITVFELGLLDQVYVDLFLK